MDLNKTYKTETGAERTPLCLSSCNIFVFVECKYSDGKILKKWFWKNHRLFKPQDSETIKCPESRN